MGAFDIYLLAKQYAPDADPRQYYPHWRGGYYLAAHERSAQKDQIALLYLSRWDSPEAAGAFAKLYSGYVPHRYNVPVGSTPSVTVSRDTSGGMKYVWDLAQQGKVVIQTHGNDVLILEGFDNTTADRIRDALLINPQPPVSATHNN